MQPFKIENYERDHGQGSFVPFRHLSDREANAIRCSVAKCLKLPENIPANEMVQIVQDRSISVAGFNAQDNDFCLLKVLDRLQYIPSEVTYLNWYRYDDIDEIQTADILSKFDDIWYPSTDDMDLIDSNMKWFLSIHHSGAISALPLEK